MVVAVLELDLEHDPAKERRRWVEHEPVHARLEVPGEIGGPPVSVGEPHGEAATFPIKLDANSLGRTTGARIEHVCRKRDAHGARLRELGRFQ